MFRNRPAPEAKLLRIGIESIFFPGKKCLPKTGGLSIGSSFNHPLREGEWQQFSTEVWT